MGGRGTLVGAIIATLLVNFGRTFLSENFPEIWLFFQGALFLLVVTILPNGIVGWWQEYGWSKLRSLLGYSQLLMTYYNVDKNREFKLEREELEKQPLGSDEVKNKW